MKRIRGENLISILNEYYIVSKDQEDNDLAQNFQ